MDVSRLDLRIGKFVSVKQHPDADTLYVEEGNPLLTNHMTITCWEMTVM